MKKYFPILTIFGIAAILVISCKREYTVAAGNAVIGSSAYLKIVHASPNFTKIFSQPDNLNVFVGTTKINGSALKYNTTFPLVGNTYAIVPSGTQTVKISFGGVVTPDSIGIISMQKNLTPGAYYTLVITDSIRSARDSSQIWVQDTYPQPLLGPGFVYIRFFHAVMDGLTDTVDLFSSRRNLVLFSKVKMDSITPFGSFPSIAGGGNDTFYVRKYGTTTVLARLISLPMGDQQFFSTYYIGDTAASPAAKTRALIYNQNK